MKAVWKLSSLQIEVFTCVALQQNPWIFNRAINTISSLKRRGLIESNKDEWFSEKLDFYSSKFHTVDEYYEAQYKFRGFSNQFVLTALGKEFASKLLPFYKYEEKMNTQQNQLGNVASEVAVSYPAQPKQHIYCLHALTESRDFVFVKSLYAEPVVLEKMESSSLWDTGYCMMCDQVHQNDVIDVDLMRVYKAVYDHLGDTSNTFEQFVVGKMGVRVRKTPNDFMIIASHIKTALSKNSDWVYPVVGWPGQGMSVW